MRACARGRTSGLRARARHVERDVFIGCRKLRPSRVKHCDSSLTSSPSSGSSSSSNEGGPTSAAAAAADRMATAAARIWSALLQTATAHFSAPEAAPSGFWAEMSAPPPPTTRIKSAVARRVARRLCLSVRAAERGEGPKGCARAHANATRAQRRRQLARPAITIAPLSRARKPKRSAGAA